MLFIRREGRRRGTTASGVTSRTEGVRKQGTPASAAPTPSSTTAAASAAAPQSPHAPCATNQPISAHSMPCCEDKCACTAGACACGETCHCRSCDGGAKARMTATGCADCEWTHSSRMHACVRACRQAGTAQTRGCQPAARSRSSSHTSILVVMCGAPHSTCARSAAAANTQARPLAARAGTRASAALTVAASRATAAGRRRRPESLRPRGHQPESRGAAACGLVTALFRSRCGRHSVDGGGKAAAPPRSVCVVSGDVKIQLHIFQLTREPPDLDTPQQIPSYYRASGKRRPLPTTHAHTQSASLLDAVTSCVVAG